MINHWHCESCKSYNDVLTNYCRICQAYKPLWVTTEYQVRVEIKRGIYLDYGIYGVSSMTEEEQLFADFYNKEKLLVKDMNDDDLDEHRALLSKIAKEAKARLVAADDEKRERKAKVKNKEWLLTDNKPDQTVTDAINNVQARKARMSKLDKLKIQLEAAGLDEATITEMMKNMEKKATDKQVKTVTFKKPSTEIGVVQVKPAEESKPFDPSELFGKKE